MILNGFFLQGNIFFQIESSIMTLSIYTCVWVILFHCVQNDDVIDCMYKRTIHSHGILQQLQVEPWGSDSLRIRLSPNVIIQTPDYQALLPEKPMIDQSKCFKSKKNMFTYGNIRFTLDTNNKTWSIQRQSDQVTFIQTQTTLFAPYQYPASVYSPVYALYNVSLTYTHLQNGYLYGLGQHHYGDNLTLPYHNFHLPFIFSSTVPTNGDITIPWYIHTSGFGFLWNQPGYGSFDVENDTKLAWTATAAHQLDLWITTIPSETDLNISPYPKIMENFVNAIGHPNSLPRFASGFWHCKNRYRTQDELLNVAKGYYDRQIPVSVIVIDQRTQRTAARYSALQCAAVQRSEA